MKFIDLFAGIGGFRIGLEQAGHTCVWTNEWLEKPASIYERNFGDKPDRRDIREVTADSIPEADLIVGGFPCATFSIAGKRAGFCLEDTRGTLCFEMFRLAKDNRIPYILFENVKGLLNHDNGQTFQVILSALDEMGYDAQWELLDSQNFGVPQHRERIFLIASLRGKPRPKIFPITEPKRPNDEKNGRKQKTREGLFSNISPTLDAHYYKGGASRPYVVTQWRRGYFRDYKGEGTPTLTANMGTGGNNVPFVKMTMRSHTKANMKQRTQLRDVAWTLDTKPQDKMAIHTQKLINQVKVRKYKVDTEKLKKLLREHKKLPTMEIAKRLNIKETKVAHWFRKKSSFSIPDPEIWFDLKELLNIKTNEFDLPIMKFEIKDNKFDMANRIYGIHGVSPTLTATQSSHQITNGEDIRKLTPLECERLQGLPDNFTKYYADGSLVSDSERWERCGRTVTIPIIKAIGEKLNEIQL